MNQKISRLPDDVINQIAAGEVVENPASIVKELVENSLDAGAKRITVEIVHGGQQLIRVEDDGCGMGPEDAEGCLERHATSKIRSVDDLQELVTMGFRGEALAAIASVSHLELKTSDGTATRILTEGGQVKVIEPCARNQGTTIEVRSLFYNVPARKKFQKSAGANGAQVRRVVETIALAHPEVAFSLTVGGKKTFDVAMSSKRQRVEEILGEHEHAVEAASISGFIGAPSKATSTRSSQYLFINRRPIFSPLVAKAVKEGFGTRIAEHAYPQFVLFLEISPESVDVNVHPQKKEVRFKDEAAIFRSVQKAVEGAFGAAVDFSSPISFDSPPLSSFAESFSFPAFKTVETPELDLTFRDLPLAVIGNYLLLQREHLILVDLLAAHARILFESLKYEKGTAQALIWPLEVKINPGDEEIVEELGGLGIECRLLQRTLVIDALPPFLEAADFPLFFANWKEGKKIENVTARFSRAVRKVYPLHEAVILWRRLQKCRDLFYDPLGNPIWVEVKPEELGQMIGRGKAKGRLSLEGVYE